MAKPLALYYTAWVSSKGPIRSDICDRTTWSPSIAQSLAPTKLPSGQQLHARCMQLASQQGCPSTAQYRMWTTLDHTPHFSPRPSLLSRLRKEKKSKTTTLASQVPQPISAVAFRFHQHTRPSFNHSDLLPVPEITVHQSSRSLPPAANLPWPHVATGSPRGVVPIRKFAGSIIHHDPQLSGAFWCPARHAPHPSMYLIQALATIAARSLCSGLGYPVHATT